eukprot:2979973-Amphidinium_carterae.1
MTRGALLEGLRRNPNLKAWVKVVCTGMVGGRQGFMRAWRLERVVALIYAVVVRVKSSLLPLAKTAPASSYATCFEMAVM